MPFFAHGQGEASHLRCAKTSSGLKPWRVLSYQANSSRFLFIAEHDKCGRTILVGTGHTHLPSFFSTTVLNVYETVKQWEIDISHCCMLYLG